MPVLDTQTKEHSRLGHNFGAISVFPPASPLQPKQVNGVVNRLAASKASSQGELNGIPRLPESWRVYQPIQAKRSVAQPNAAYEPGADGVAAPNPAAPIAQRSGEEAQLLQGKFAPVQRKGSESARNPRENKTGLPDNLKTNIESLSGISLDNVKIHYNSSRPAQLNALAYAQGSDIHVAPGQERHLPHEAWHVVQQAQGRVQPIMQMKDGVPVNDDKGLEREADMMGDKAAQMNVAEPAAEVDETAQLRPATAQPSVMQMVKFMTVKRIANNGSLYVGVNVAGGPNLGYNGGTNWYGSKATANVYAAPPGGLYQVRAQRPLNLIDMGSVRSVRKAMNETVRRTANNLSANLQAALGNNDFAYAIPRAVANVAEMALQYGLGNGPWQPNPYVNQAAVDNAIPLAGGVAANRPLVIGSVIEPFAGRNSANVVRLDNAGFLANPNAYVVIRKDVTAGDLGFADALLNDLNDPNMFHGLHVPAGMKFGGWTGTINEVLIKNSQHNLQLVGPVNHPGPEPDMNITDKIIGVDNSLLARAWRFFGGNR